MRYAKGIVSALLIAALATGSIILLVWLSGRNSTGRNESGYAPPTLFAMDTTLDFIIRGRGEEQAKKDVAAAYALAKDIEAHASLFEPESDVSKVNAGAGKSAVKVQADALYMVEKSVEYGDKTGGAFDITITPVEALWGFYDQKYRVPSDVEIASALQLVNYKDIVVDHNASTVMLKKTGMRMDLGGVAKGYAVEVMCKLLERRGVKSALVNFGGAVGTIGKRANGGAWVVGIRSARGQSGDLAGSMLVSDNYVSSSGDYERFFIRNGVRYCHILDPRTGKQPGGVVSVTVVGSNSTVNDILSTALFVMGPSIGKQFIETQSGCDALFIEDDTKTEITPGMTAKYHLTFSP